MDGHSLISERAIKMTESGTIKSSDGTVLGTFGMYFEDVRIPSDEEMKGEETPASAASVVIRFAG